MENIAEVQKKHEILAKKISEMEYGDTIMHSEIESVIGEPYGSQKYRTIVSKAKSVLLNEYNRNITSVHGKGYTVPYPDDYVDTALGHYKRASRQVRKGKRVLEHCPVGDMTAQGREAHRRVYDKMLILDSAMQGTRVELKMLSKRNHPFALENIKR